MSFASTSRALAVAAVVALGATSAWAQQVTTYGITQATVGSLWEPMPSTGVTQTSITGDDSAGTFTLPFTFPYFGTNYTSFSPSTNGLVGLAGSSTVFSNVALPASGFNGYLMPYWDDLIIQATTLSAISSTPPSGTTPQYPPNLSYIYYWTTGTAPNRHLTILWQGNSSLSSYSTLNGSTSFSFECMLFETTGSIWYSYIQPSGATWYSGNSYTCGIQSPSGSYEYPSSLNNAGTNAGRPPYDYKFDNFRVTFTGQALYNRLVVDQNGIGATQEMNLPLAGMSVEARNDTGATVGSAITDSAGNFNLVAVGVAPTVVGSIVITSAGSACSVRKTLNGALYAATLKPSVSFAGDLDVGTLTLSDSNDPTGAAREPINIVRTIQSVYAYATARTTKPIQRVDPVLYDTASAASTSYTIKNGATLASMRVGSALSGNPDAWDNSVIRKVYGRHILGAIAGDPVTAYDDGFDKATDDQNAFAEGFGHYMNAVISRETKYIDGTSATSANVIDLESPTGILTPKSSNVAAWCTAALYDLTDGGTNESWDTFDGSGAAGDQVFLAAAAISPPAPATPVPATAANFFAAWATKGYDGSALARNFIRHGLLPDDGDEPNDYSSEATQISQFGFVRTNRVLTQFNDDYYRFTMAYPTNVLTIDCVYDRVLYPSAVVLLELQSTAGGVLATGAPIGGQGAIEAKSGAIPAGDYLVHVKLTAGGTIPKYTLQAFSELAFTSGQFPTWTLGRAINVPVNVTGGIPPYSLVVVSPFQVPPGLILDGVNARVAGSPSDRAHVPAGGSLTYDFILSAQDSASPTPNLASGSVTFTVNDEVKQHFSPFAAFPYGKPVDVRAPFAGGTAPFTTSIDAGALPSGLTASGGAALRISGTPDSPGSYAFTMTGTDFAGSTDTASSTGVACVPIAQSTPIAAGASACGFYFDVVKGSTIALTAATVKQPGKKAAPRALRATMLDKDGNTVLIQPGLKAGKGKVASGKFTAPSTGRFFFIVSSDDGGAPATLAVKAKIVADKGAKGDSGVKLLVSPDVYPVEVGTLAGGVLTFTAKPAKNSGLLLKGAYLLDPAGNIVQFADGEVAERPDGSITFKRTLTASGTWSVVVGAKPGPQGSFSYVFTVKEPAKAVYSAD